MQICWLVHVQRWQTETWEIKTLQRNEDEDLQKQEDATPISNQEGEAPWHEEILIAVIYRIPYR